MNFKVNETATKLRGGYYTPPDIAQFLLKWVLVSAPENLLEPSCGDGAFFRTLTHIDHPSLKSITAFEIEPHEAAKAQESANQLSNLETKLHASDFLTWALTNLLMPPLFDAVIGNPPFIRYQYLDKHIQMISQEIFRCSQLNFTKHTNLWVAFVIASLRLLKPRGRLAMIVPSELLHILYAQSLRGYLAQTCSKIMLFDPQEIWFENTLQGAVLLLAEKKALPTDKSFGVSIVQTHDKTFLDQHPEDYFQTAHYANGETVEGKWMTAFLNESERTLLKAARQHIPQFSEVADVAVGIVTGANKYFLVPDYVVEKYELTKWAHPMFGRSEHVPGIIYDQAVAQQNKQAGLPTNFLWFQNEAELSESAQNYIKVGEAESLHTRYKCRVREPWYTVPSVYATPVGMLKRSHDFPRLIFNKLEAFTTDTAYRIKIKKFDAHSLVYSFLNSLTALTAELEGRHYGGGVLELVPSEIRQLLIPVSPATEQQVYELDALIRSRTSAETVLAKQDEILLAKFDKPSILALQAAWLRLKCRRQRQPQAAEPEEVM